jgi:ribonuclease P protein component
MRGEQYITKPEQFTAIYDKGSSWVNKIVVLKVIPNNLEITRYGFSVSSRVGGAVVRNRTKRRLREIIRQIQLNTGWDLIIIARPTSAGVEYKELKSSVSNLLNKARLVSMEIKQQEIS